MGNWDKFNIKVVYDSDIVPDNLVTKYQIQDYCYQKKGVWKIDFVGFFYIHNQLIVSFPKHYRSTLLLEKDFTLLSKVLISYTNTFGVLDKENADNFPYKPYLNICNYYLNYGLYQEYETILKRGYGGKINWKSTINKSTKVINENNLIFMPFYIKQSKNLSVFLTECMMYVLEDGYKIFGKYFNHGVRYTTKPNNRIFNRLDLVVQELNYIKGSYFKDSTLKLINNLIKYFTWKSNYVKKDKLSFLTMSFANIWESMVEKYLNENLFLIDSHNNQLIFKENCNRFNFQKKEDTVESPQKLEISPNKFTVIYDHLYENDSTYFLFDSKYYMKITDLNYKQVSYYYFLKKTFFKESDTIYNGLILPTEFDYYSKVHIDRRDIDGLFILEYYLNLKKVMETYISRK